MKPILSVSPTEKVRSEKSCRSPKYFESPFADKMVIAILLFFDILVSVAQNGEICNREKRSPRKETFFSNRCGVDGGKLLGGKLCVVHSGNVVEDLLRS